MMTDYDRARLEEANELYDIYCSKVECSNCPYMADMNEDASLECVVLFVEDYVADDMPEYVEEIVAMIKEEN